MQLSFKQRKRYVYCGDSSSCLLAEVARNKEGKPLLKNIAVGDGPPTCPGTLRRLLSQASPTVGKVAMVLPLQFFEIVNLSLPMLPEEAVGRTLPYHLSKAVDKPLSDYIYDWQITKRQKEQMQVVVYLFSAGKYRILAEEFRKHQLETVFFEADVFAAFAFLDLAGKLEAEAATLCVIVWPDSLSLAVCEDGRVELARTVDLPRPESNPAAADGAPHLAEGEGEATEEAGVDEVAGGHGEELLSPEAGAGYGNTVAEANAILAGFDIFPTQADQPQHGRGPVVRGEGGPLEMQIAKLPPAPPTPWDAYLEAINIEIMRTRDYHSSVVKGKKIKSYYVLGAEDFFGKLSNLVLGATGEEVKMVLEQAAGRNGNAILQVVGVGVATRG
ncbi:MAG: hypothetical protein OEV91_06685 [Desulfobulbaceae bacterium]|nr:hypothetical protein [Desulfobulbaceae bacterium]HIJ91729.1 hypothetical protein [Deltaproteobacteria bacterium]